MQTVFEADRAKEGFYIRSGIVVIAKNATIKDNTVIWSDRTHWSFPDCLFSSHPIQLFLIFLMTLHIRIVMVWGKFVELNFENFGAVRKERDACVEESRFEGVLPEYLYATATAISLVGLDLDVEPTEANHWCALL